MRNAPEIHDPSRGSSWQRLALRCLAGASLLQVGGCGVDTLLSAVLAELSRLSGSFVFSSVQTIAENLLDV